MSYLVDTNVLSRSAQATHPMHEVAVRAVKVLFEQSEQLCVIPQTLIEFWVVATRPIEVNGLGLPFANALLELAQIKSFFVLQLDTPVIFTEWEQLITKHHVTGKKAHDTRLVAAMIAHKLTHLLTFNTDDFKRFTEIIAVDPRSIPPQPQL